MSSTLKPEIPQLNKGGNLVEARGKHLVTSGYTDDAKIMRTPIQNRLQALLAKFIDAAPDLYVKDLNKIRKRTFEKKWKLVLVRIFITMLPYFILEPLCMLGYFVGEQ